MKTLSSFLLMTVLAAPAAWAQKPATAEQALIAVEHQWSEAAVKRDGAALDRFYADEYIFTNEDGVASNKAKEIANITTGVFRLTAYKFGDLKVQVYGNVAVVTGENTITGTWEDINKDITGPYRFTDVFVNRAGRWQAVASQSSRITLAAEASSATKASPPNAEKKAMMAGCMDKMAAMKGAKKEAVAAKPGDDHSAHQHPDGK